jgi:NAD(P)-dependent dehydrogenase (short-subunit alcohol dehydrogenase family)
MSNASYDFTGKVAFVTGGASGIGRAAVERFARSGAAVALADIHLAAAETLSAQLNDAGGKTIALALDVTDRDAVQRVVAQVQQQFGRIDFAVNSAGIAGSQRSIVDVDPAEFKRVFAINVEGLLYCMQAELAVMAQQGFGSVVNMSSAAGLAATPFMSPYGASKHAVLGLTRSAALEYANQNVRVNSVCPAAVDTPMVAATFMTPEGRRVMEATHPAGRIAKPEEVAAMIVFACSDESSYSTGVEFRVNGGYHI